MAGQNSLASSHPPTFRDAGETLGVLLGCQSCWGSWGCTGQDDCAWPGYGTASAERGTEIGALFTPHFLANYFPHFSHCS